MSLIIILIIIAIINYSWLLRLMLIMIAIISLKIIEVIIIYTPHFYYFIYNIMDAFRRDLIYHVIVIITAIVSIQHCLSIIFLMEQVSNYF